MELTAEQLVAIDRYLKDRHIKYLDLRMEMTDHLATEIEDLMNRVRIPSFDEAFDEIKTKYHDSLLRKIRQSKEQSMNLYWNGRFKAFWKSYFSFPKIAFTLMLMVAFFTLRHIPFRDSSLLTMLNILLSTCGVVLSLIVLLRSLWSKTRMIIIESYAMNLMIPFLGLQIVYQLESLLEINPSEAIWLALLLSSSNAIFIIGLIGHYSSFRPWLKTEFETNYAALTSK